MKFKHFLLTGAFAIYSITPASAYRGQEFTTQETSVENPGSNIPGYFDAYVLPKGKLQMQIPTFALDYGVTENLTIGTNPVPLLMMGLTRIPAFTLNARYRFFANDSFSSSITGYGGSMWFTPQTQGKDGPTTNFHYIAATSTTSYFYNPDTVFSFYFGGLHLGTSINMNERESNTLYSFAFLTGLGFQKYFNSVIGIEAQLMIPLAFSLNAELGAMNIDANFLHNSTFLPHRLFLNIKTGENALLSLGMMGIFSPQLGKELWVPAGNFVFRL